MNPQILSTSQNVFFFPVRHHSPAAARLIEEYILKNKPAAVLIEGPADFNPQMAQLALPHTLPIAIYSYAIIGEDKRFGVFYPFCDYSPEWCAIRAAKEIACPVAFIDMPWSQLAFGASRKNRYSDAPLLRSDYVGALCKKFSVENIHELWDTLFEIDPDLSLDEYLKRCHHICYHMRLADGAEHEDILREEFMEAEIRRARDSLQGQIVVVTGGFHSYALFARLLPDHNALQPFLKEVGSPAVTLNLQLSPENVPSSNSPDTQRPGSSDLGTDDGDDRDPSYEDFEDPLARIKREEKAQGISLTPYSYERLDLLTGYESGMPNPGFYHEAHHDMKTGATDTYRKLLFKAVNALREKKQQISTADVIAVENMAMGLATLRGHKRIWRQDLIDAILGALVKDELSVGLRHPLQDAIDKIMRGDQVGKLAEGTILPPLVRDIERVIAHYDLQATSEHKARLLELNLHIEADRERSCYLHRLSCLNIPGFNLLSEPLAFMDDTSGKSVERWALTRHQGFAAACIEAAIYGSALSDAAAFKLVEIASGVENDSAECAYLLMTACLMGYSALSADFCEKLRSTLAHDSDLSRTARALSYMLYLYRYDDVLKDKPIESIGELLIQCFDRCVWLLESTGAVDQSIGEIMRTILETFERCQHRLHIDRAYFIDVLNRVRTDDRRDAILRGAATGSLWTLDEAPPETVLADVGLFSRPEQIGDFLTGLFLLAKEASKHRKDLLLKVDEFLMGFSTEEYLEALPHLRLAFAVFTPREKYHMARLIMGETGALSTITSELDLDVTSAAMVLEAEVKSTLVKFGLRGLNDDQK